MEVIPAKRDRNNGAGVVTVAPGIVSPAVKGLLALTWFVFACVVWVYLFLYWLVRGYEEEYGWKAGLDAFAPEFGTYWKTFLYIAIVSEVAAASALWAYLWKTRDRNLAALTPWEHLCRNLTHLHWLVAYAWALYWGASFFTEQDAIWHQMAVRDTDFTPSHIVTFYLSYPIFIITGGGAFLYAKTRLPYFAEGISLPYLIMVVGTFMMLPSVGLHEWGHSFWFMDELFVAPVHWGFVIFGWLALALMGTLTQTFYSITKLIGEKICEAIEKAKEGEKSEGALDGVSWKAEPAETWASNRQRSQFYESLLYELKALGLKLQTIYRQCTNIAVRITENLAHGRRAAATGWRDFTALPRLVLLEHDSS